MQLCAPSLTITKVVTSSANPEPTPADGWTFDTTVTIPQGNGQWVKPGTDAITAGVPSTKSLATSQSGAATFQWEPVGDLVTDPVLVKETTKVGYSLQPDLKCTAKNLLEETQREFTATVGADGKWNLGAIDPKEIVTCTATNVLKDTGSLTITKEFNAQASNYTGTFDITYSCVDGADKIKEGTLALAAGKSETISGLPTGTVCTVTEPKLPANPTGWTFNPPTFTPSNQATITTKDQKASVTVTNSVAQVNPVVVKKICPIDVTLHKPQPKKVGNRIMTDKIKTKKSSCVLLKPVVLCRPIAASAAGETAFCDTKVTQEGPDHGQDQGLRGRARHRPRAHQAQARILRPVEAQHLAEVLEIEVTPTRRPAPHRAGLRQSTGQRRPRTGCDGQVRGRLNPGLPRVAARISKPRARTSSTYPSRQPGRLTRWSSNP